ncbi:MAG: hypothetical protein ACFE8U_14075 [Candidatus Hermodarchaeota archaeon]
MSESTHQSEDREEISDIIKILSFLNYEGTIRLYDVDAVEAFH